MVVVVVSFFLPGKSYTEKLYSATEVKSKQAVVEMSKFAIRAVVR